MRLPQKCEAPCGGGARLGRWPILPIVLNVVWYYTSILGAVGHAAAMDNAGQVRRALEDFWRERTQVALQQYREAKAATSVAKMERAHGVTPTPDGGFAWRQALRTESAALQEYCRVLEIFNGLVIYRRLPPPESE